MPAPGAWDALADDELVTRRLVELAVAARSDWEAVDRLLEDASRQLASNEWVTAMLQAMQGIAEGRSRERMMKEAMDSSSKLRSRLVAQDEDVQFCAAAE